VQLLRGLMTLPAPRASRRLLQRCEYERAPQAACDLDVHENVLRKWVKGVCRRPAACVPGQGQMKPEQLEIERLRREVIRLKAEAPPPTRAPGAGLAPGFPCREPKRRQSSTSASQGSDATPSYTNG